MKFKPGDTVMLISSGQCRCQSCLRLSPGMVGQVQRACLICTIVGGSGYLRYHVEFASGMWSVDEQLLKKIGDDPDADADPEEQHIDIGHIESVPA